MGHCVYLKNTHILAYSTSLCAYCRILFLLVPSGQFVSIDQLVVVCCEREFDLAILFMSLAAICQFDFVVLRFQISHCVVCRSDHASPTRV